MVPLAEISVAVQVVGWLLIALGVVYAFGAVRTTGYRRTVRAGFALALIVIGVSRLLSVIPVLVAGIVLLWIVLYYGVVMKRRQQ